MWIRIESFAGDALEPQATLNVCCNTLRQEAGEPEPALGILLHLGRKAGEITFEKDKSVSRQHCTLRLFGTGYPPGVLPEPRNPAERRACSSDPLRMCLVLCNEGKGGSYVAEAIPTPHPGTNDDHNDGSDTDAGGSSDDETDDEGVSQKPTQRKASKASVQPSKRTAIGSSIASLGQGTVTHDVRFAPATRRHWPDESLAHLIKLDAGEQRVLAFSQGGISSSVIVQVGLNESAIRLTRVPFRVALSRMPKKLTKWSKDFYKIGAVEDAFVTEATTHLVTPEVAGTAKPLTAWCRGLPMLAPSYLEALLDRLSPSDPLPDPKDHWASFKINMSFLRQKANPRLMETYVVLMAEQAEELEGLIRFAGARVVPLFHDDGDDASIAIARAREVLREAQRHGKVCLILPSIKILFRKVVAALKEEDGTSFFVVKQTSWAKAISQQNPRLKDAEGNPIELASPPTLTSSSGHHLQTQDGLPADDQSAHTWATVKSQADTVTSGSGKSSGSISVPTKAPKTSDKEGTASTTTEADNPGDSAGKSQTTESDSRNGSSDRTKPGDSEGDHPITETSSWSETQLPGARRKRRLDPSQTSGTDSTSMNSQSKRETLQQQKRPRKVASRARSQEEEKDAFPSAADETSEEKREEIEDEPMTVETESMPQQDLVRRAVSIGIRRDSREDSSVSGTSTVERHPPSGLTKADSDGWFTVAPKEDAKRRALWKQASKKQADATDGTHFLPPARSERGAVIVSPESGNLNSSRGTIPIRNARRRNGANFKRFRKNIVPRTMDPSEYVAMRAVHPKETEQQRQMEENQRELEAEQRRADELFRDLGGGTVRRRRR